MHWEKKLERTLASRMRMAPRRQASNAEANRPTGTALGASARNPTRAAPILDTAEKSKYTVTDINQL